MSISDEITSFIINELDTHSSSIAARAALKFGLSRQAVQARLQRLVKQGVLEATGRTRNKKYSLATNRVVFQSYDAHPKLEEHVVYMEDVEPALIGLPDNILRICAYGFTEMLNNVIDHSQSESVYVEVSRTPCVVEIAIGDKGIGIFKKIKDAFALDDERQSLLELSKGKMTTDPLRHTGEGIFFTSRVFDQFSILSGALFFWHRTDHDDWLVETRANSHPGTRVSMRICTLSKTTTKEVFDRFTTPNNEFGFARTHVPVSLAQYDGNLFSRSQAKRVLARFDRFEEVMLDFAGVNTVGQAFADEIFRVFRLQNPQIKVSAIRATPEVMAMIARATNEYDAEQARRNANSADDLNPRT